MPRLQVHCGWQLREYCGFNLTRRGAEASSIDLAFNFLSACTSRRTDVDEVTIHIRVVRYSINCMICTGRMGSFESNTGFFRRESDVLKKLLSWATHKKLPQLRRLNCSFLPILACMLFTFKYGPTKVQFLWNFKVPSYEKIVKWRGPFYESSLVDLWVSEWICKQLFLKPESDNHKDSLPKDTKFTKIIVKTRFHPPIPVFVKHFVNK